MNIGEASRSSGVPSKTIRYYESIGLIPEATRSESGYRTFDPRDIETLRFVQRARGLGFSVPSVSKLLNLWYDRTRASADVKALALSHIEKIDQKIEALRDVRNSLTSLTEQCHGDGRPNCPILENFARDDELS
ncbi:MAG: MerR family copper efflux transcriptional regulator [Alphaproteobacteria bacterium]|jgi:MerR family copper efflux transcriptional regulator